MNEERLKILQMLQEGKLTVDEATRLLEAAETLRNTAAPHTTPSPAITDEQEDGDEPMPSHRRTIRLQGATLERLNFTGANLQGVDFAGQDLQGFDFTGANLREANLCEANLTNVNLTGANLSGADLRNANLTNASLIGVALRNTLLDGANLSGAELIGIDLSGYKLRNGVLEANKAAPNRGGEQSPNLSRTVMGDAVRA